MKCWLGGQSIRIAICKSIVSQISLEPLEKFSGGSKLLVQWTVYSRAGSLSLGFIVWFRSRLLKVAGNKLLGCWASWANSPSFPVFVNKWLKTWRCTLIHTAGMLRGSPGRRFIVALRSIGSPLPGYPLNTCCKERAKFCGVIPGSTWYVVLDEPRQHPRPE